MADTYDAATRSRTMRAVKGSDTKPELALRKALWAIGARGWRCHRRDLPGRPDVAFGNGKVAVFVDGAFWHGRADKYWPGRSGAYWDRKIARNQARDQRVNAALEEAGWAVVRLWDDHVLADPHAAAASVLEVLHARRSG